MTKELLDSGRRYIDPIKGKGAHWVADQRDGKRKNIVLISLDMVPMEFHHEISGGFPIRTPNIDRLRTEGVDFCNTFSTSPLCSPSRASYLTGRYSYITGNSERAHDGHEIHLREDDILWSEYLKADGYHMRHVGKSHIGTHKLVDVFTENDSPWNRWSPPWYDEDAYLQYLADRGLSPMSFERRIYGKAPGTGTQGNFYGGWIAPQNGSAFPKDGTYPAYLVHRAVRALKMRKRTAPYFLQLDFFGPHQPFAIPGEMEDRAEELRAALSLPDSYQRLMEQGFKTPEGEPRIYDLYRRNWGLTDPETVREYRIANILQYELLDEMVGRLLTYLREEGLYDDTWIYLISDHGEMNCESGLIDKGAYLNPRVLRVPLIVKPPVDRTDVWHPGTQVTMTTSLLDLAPTILDEAGIMTPERLDGIDLKRVLAGEQRPESHPIMGEIWNHVMPNPAVATVFTSADGSERFFSYNITDKQDELYELTAETGLVNLLAGEVYEPGDELSAPYREALMILERRLAKDPRWNSYLSYMRLEYAGVLGPRGDNQFFIV